MPKGIITNGGVVIAGRISGECMCADGRVKKAPGITDESTNPDGCIVEATCVVIERTVTDSRVVPPSVLLKSA